jgi:hypothetical protein
VNLPTGGGGGELWEPSADFSSVGRGSAARSLTGGNAGRGRGVECKLVYAGVH